MIGAWVPPDGSGSSGSGNNEPVTTDAFTANIVGGVPSLGDARQGRGEGTQYEGREGSK